MPRAKKTRRCGCAMAHGGKPPAAFKPAGVPLHDLEQVTLQIDELECLRLCDRDALTQQEAGERMGISRGTVQRLLTSARLKVADALSSCKAIMLDRDECGHIEMIKSSRRTLK